LVNLISFRKTGGIMFRKMLLLSAVITSFVSFNSLAQGQDTVIVEGEDGVKDTILIEDEEWNEDSWSDKWEEDWDRDWDGFDWDFDLINDFKGKPTISFNYGLSKLSMYDYDPEFGDPNLVEGKIGYASESSYFGNNVARYSYKYFRLSNISTKLSNKDFAADELESSLWRFGFGRETGYGWKFGESAIIPYNGNAFDWSRLEMKEFPLTVSPDGISDAYALERYNETFRFGTSTEAGIKFRLIGGITLEGSYERSIIFERHLFWKWAGSTVIEVAAHGLLDEFIDEVGESSPFAAPIVNFVLKNALSYGIYELRTEKMNWPFNSAPPLTYDQFKFGLTFMF
jgi:hypothetical protein